MGELFISKSYGGFMKRWQTKLEKWLVGSLFLLLILSSLPGAFRFQAKSIQELIGTETMSSSSNTIEDCFENDEDTYNCKVKIDKKNDNVKIELEATSGCEECLNGEITLRNENLNSIKDVENYLSKNKALISKKLKKAFKANEDDEEDEDESIADLKLRSQCKNKKDNDEDYINCLGDKFIIIAKKKEKKKYKYSANQLMKLFKKEVRGTLEEGLLSEDKDTRKAFEKLHRRILSKMDDYKTHQLVRQELLSLSNEVYLSKVNDVKDIIKQANELSKTNPVSALSLLNEFQIQRASLIPQTMSQIENMDSIYRSLIQNNPNFLPAHGYHEMMTHFTRPMTSSYQGLWNSNLFQDPMGQYQMGQYPLYDQRMARIQSEPYPGFASNRGDTRSGGGNVFPPSPFQQNAGYYPPGHPGYGQPFNNQPPFQNGNPWGPPPPTAGPYYSPVPQHPGPLYGGPNYGNPQNAYGPGYWNGQQPANPPMAPPPYNGVPGGYDSRQPYNSIYPLNNTYGPVKRF